MSRGAPGAGRARDVSWRWTSTTVANLGAYMSGGGPGSSTNAPAARWAAVMSFLRSVMDVRAAFTNTVPIDAYRGAGKPEANYLIERLIDQAARRVASIRIELRRRNMIASFPYHKALGTRGRLRPFRRQHR